jgi:hypothetical protein
MRFRLPSILLCGILLVAVTASTAPARTSAAPTVSPQALVTAYLNNFNSITKGGSTSQLPQIYAPTATLVVSTPDGKTATFHGLTAITGWYKAFGASHVGLVVKATNVRAYNASGTLVGRCAHFFAVTNNLIVSDDFVVYWGH